jgi:hypothetical protein
MVRCLGAVTGLFSGMMAGLACSALGLLAIAANPDPAPQASRDPVARFDLDIVSPLVVSVEPPFYQPIRDRMEQVGLFTVIANSTIPALEQITSPAGSTMGSQVARGLAGVHGNDPWLDLPEPGPDEPVHSGEVTNSLTVPYLGDLGRALPDVRAELSVGLNVVPGNGFNAGTAGPEHFLQGGYFAHRENAVGLSEKLVSSGLNVLMEQMTNRAGKTRWRVLVGPYRQKGDALRARGSAPTLLAEGFHIIHDN